MLLLTATPHSGIEDAFQSLLELLDPEFANFDLSKLSEEDRVKMALHFVQRRRADVKRWLGDETPFPERLTRESSYSLANSPEYNKLFEDIYRFARELVQENTAGLTKWKQRVRYWTALALLRCVMSSPAAAEATLRVKLRRTGGSEEEFLLDEGDDNLLAEHVLDLSEQEITQDFEPTSVIEEGEAIMLGGERQRLQSFVKRSVGLYGDKDPKLLAAVKEVISLLQDGFQPIVYCRYIATAKYLAEELKRRLGSRWADLQIIAVTGESAEEEREQRVAELSSSPRRVLVATDCLSEGINLQEAFNAVLHYDLPWNPNRLEQREGRVDRYGQPAPYVRTVTLYGKDNPIDKAVLDVLLRKSVSIHKTLGISVPMPISSASMVETVVKALFQEEQKAQQLEMFDRDRQLGMFGQNAVGGEAEQEMSVNSMNLGWDRAVEREKASRTRFAQHAIKPEEVEQELRETDAVLGNARTVVGFVHNACQRLNVPLVVKQASPEKNKPERHIWKLALASLREHPLIYERVAPLFTPLKAKQPPDEVLISFEGPLPEGVKLIGRLHPLTEALAEYLLDNALQATSPNLLASRAGVTRTSSVNLRTTLLLLRMRLLIDSPGRSVPMLAEELVVAGFEGSPAGGNLKWLDPAQALKLLDNVEIGGSLTAVEKSDQLTRVLDWLPALEPDLAKIGEVRANVLLEAHRRVRRATRLPGQVSVRPKLPLDVLGL